MPFSCGFIILNTVQMLGPRPSKNTCQSTQITFISLTFLNFRILCTTIISHSLKTFLLSYFSVYECFVCTCACASCVCLLPHGKKRAWLPWNWSYRWLWVIFCCKLIIPLLLIGNICTCACMSPLKKIAVASIYLTYLKTFKGRKISMSTSKSLTQLSPRSFSAPLTCIAYPETVNNRIYNLIDMYPAPGYMNKWSLYTDIIGDGDTAQMIKPLVCERLWVWTRISVYPHHWKQDRSMKFYTAILLASIVPDFTCDIVLNTYRVVGDFKKKKDISIYYVCICTLTHAIVQEWSQRTTCNSSFFLPSRSWGVWTVDSGHQTRQQASPPRLAF